MKTRPIIGVAGDIGSGKDSFGKAIQYAFLKSKVELGLSSPTLLPKVSMITDENGYLNSEFKIKKFANKLKDILCILIGCTRADLENQEFKKKTYGFEWNNMTVREMLQKIGTDLFRKNFSEDTWVNSLFAELEPDSMWVISDLRFPNEFDRIKKEGGITVKIIRFVSGEKVIYRNEIYSIGYAGSQVAYLDKADGSSLLANLSEIQKVYPTQRDESETALEHADFDYLIYNNFDAEALIFEADMLLMKEDFVKKVLDKSIF
jgi:hypothetical protein